MLKIMLVITLIVVSNYSEGKSNKCKKQYDDYKNVQRIMRERGTNEALRRQEHQKFNVYNDCRTGKTNKSVNPSPAKILKTKKPRGLSIDSRIKKHSRLYKHGDFTSNVAIKGKFKGEKQKEWLEFYQDNIPDECKKPKSTQQFAKCTETRNKAAKYFEMLWRKKYPDREAPPAIKLGNGNEEN